MFGHRSIYRDGWRAVCPWPGPSFAEANVPFGAPISADTLSELDVSGWELYRVGRGLRGDPQLGGRQSRPPDTLIGTWYAPVEQSDPFGQLDGNGRFRRDVSGEGFEVQSIAAPQSDAGLGRGHDRLGSLGSPRLAAVVLEPACYAGGAEAFHLVRMGVSSQELEGGVGHPGAKRVGPSRPEYLKQRVEARHGGAAPMDQTDADHDRPLEGITGTERLGEVEPLRVEDRKAGEQLGIQPVLVCLEK